jgi:glycine oxidase
VHVVVIGGGIVGCSVAHALADHGAEVQLIDMRGPGLGATQASAGMLAPYIEGHDEALRRLTVQSLSLYDRFIARLVTESGAPCEYARTGSLQVARTETGAQALDADAARLLSEGVACSLLDGDGVRALEPALATEIVRGLLIPSHGYVNVANLMTLLEQSLERRGVQVLVDKALAIEPAGDGLRVVTRAANVHASRVVIAAGSWSGQIAVAEAPFIPVRPVRGQVVELAFASASPVSRIVWSEDCYLVPRQPDSLIVGATMEEVGFDETVTQDAIDRLVEGARTVIPSARTATIVGTRAGLRPAGIDELPLVGWSSTMPGVCVATGHFRNGVLLAPLTARLVADALFETPDASLQWAQALMAPSRMGV